jgi:hypothetical protein
MASTRIFFILISLLTLTPYILFLGKNFLQTEFISTKYFWLAFAYFVFFVSVAFFINRFYKKFVIYILFFAYFGFLQFYFGDIQQLLKIYIDEAYGYYILFFIFFISFIATLFSNSKIFTNFILILLFTNIIISFINLIPVTGDLLKIFFKTKNVNENLLNTKNLSSIKHPNIFYIVPDSLTSPKILKEYADIDFKDSIKNFEEKGFSVSMHNYSSYSATHLSLGALFKMDYPVTEKSQPYRDRSKFYPSIRDNNSELIKFLKENNYEFIIATPRWGSCTPQSSVKCLQPNDNFIGIFLQDYAIATFLENSLIKKIFDRFQEDKNDSIKTTLNKMKKNPEIWSKGGAFTMIHALMPHAPYRLEDCTLTNRYKEPSIEGYKLSVYCTFNRINEISNYIMNTYPNATIVVQADHGVTIDTYDNMKQKKFDEIYDSYIDHRLAIFTAVRGCNSVNAAKLNQINILKYTVDCIVGRNPSMPSENRSYFAPFYETSIEYGKVFRVQKN